MLLPVAVIFSGANPIHAPFTVFVIAFAVTFALQRLAMALLSRGYAPQGMAALFEFVRLQSNLKATLTYFRRGERPFSVTAKHSTDERRRTHAPWTLWALIVLTGISLAWFACTLAGLTPVLYQIKWTVYGALFWVLVNLWFLVAALSRIRSDRFASERRAAVRLQAGGAASVEGRPGHLLDISIGGAMVRCEQPPEHGEEPLRIEFDCAGQEIALLGEERGRQTLAGGSAIIRLRFVEEQTPELARLTGALFGSTHPRQGKEARIEESAA